MKILMAARRYPPDVWSGTETVFQNLYEQARRGHEVRLVVGWTRGRELVPDEAVAVRLQGAGKVGRWVKMAGGILAEARRFKPDVVLSNSIEVPPTGFPTACIVHDLNFGEAAGASIQSTLAGRAKAAFYVGRSRGLKAVITVSRASASVLRSAGVPEAKIKVVHNGVDLERFRPDPSFVGAGTGSAERPVRFVYPSRILPGKGQHHASLATSSAAPRSPWSALLRTRSTWTRSGSRRSASRCASRPMCPASSPSTRAPTSCSSRP